MPVGSAVADTRVLLLNEDGSEAGIHGELVICSRYIALGYWRQPELSAKSFYPDPDDPGVTRYRTGDTAR